MENRMPLCCNNAVLLCILPPITHWTRSPLSHLEAVSLMHLTQQNTEETGWPAVIQDITTIIESGC